MAGWDGRNAHQPQTGAAAQRIAREACGSVACRAERPGIRLAQQQPATFYPAITRKGGEP